MRHLLLVTFLFSSYNLFSQHMTVDKLEAIYIKASDSVQRQNGTFKIVYKDALLLSMTDSNANRMRIISPITEIFNLNEDELKNALLANFHTALDVKYAIADDLLWAVFIHPLRELSEHQVEDALQQVYNAANTFGTTYSSTTLIFPGVLEKKEKPKEKPLKKTKI